MPRLRERHNWSTGKHPKTCTCATCQQRRADALIVKPKKKRKPKSQRGKGRKKNSQTDSSDALAEAMDIFGFSVPEQDQADSETQPENDKGETRDS